MRTAKRVLLYGSLTLISFVFLIPFLWMLSSSLKLDKDVLTIPIRWIPVPFSGKIT